MTKGRSTPKLSLRCGYWRVSASLVVGTGIRFLPTRSHYRAAQNTAAREGEAVREGERQPGRVKTRWLGSLSFCDLISPYYHLSKASHQSSPFPRWHSRKWEQYAVSYIHNFLPFLISGIGPRKEPPGLKVPGSSRLLSKIKDSWQWPIMHHSWTVLCLAH